jgi:hypothetical protein
MADYVPLTDTLGNLIAICPDCEAIIYRRVSLPKLDQIRGHLDITMPKAHRHISDSPNPTVNSDFE